MTPAKIGAQRHVFEFKNTESPVPTRSMHTAIETLNLDHLTVLHASMDSYARTPNICAISAFGGWQESKGLEL
jgi:hypothetical protein